MSFYKDYFGIGVDPKKVNTGDAAKLRLRKLALLTDQSSGNKGDVELGEEIIEEQKK